MSAGKHDRAHTKSGKGSWWLTAAFLAFTAGMTLSAAAEDSPCPKASTSVFHANESWRVIPAEAARDLRILAIGSSSTAGIGASEPLKTYPAQLQQRLAGRLYGVKVSVDNAGVSGETADATETRLEKVITQGDYDFVVWQVGTNDALKGGDPEAFKALLLRGIAAAKRTAAKLVLLNQQFFPGITDPVRYETFVKIVDNIGKANGVPVFSRYEMMKAWAEQSAGLLTTMLYTDKFHMSDRGYSCVAEALADSIVGVIPIMAASPRPIPAGRVAAIPASATSAPTATR